MAIPRNTIKSKEKNIINIPWLIRKHGLKWSTLAKRMIILESVLPSYPEPFLDPDMRRKKQKKQGYSMGLKPEHYWRSTASWLQWLPLRIELGMRFVTVRKLTTEIAAPQPARLGVGWTLNCIIFTDTSSSSWRTLATHVGSGWKTLGKSSSKIKLTDQL